MSDYSRREPTAGDIRDRSVQSLAAKEDFGFRYDQRSRFNTKVHYMDDAKQKVYDESRAKLLSSPLLAADAYVNAAVNKLLDFVLLNCDDPFDSFCSIGSYFKGISKEKFIKMDADARNKILGDK